MNREQKWAKVWGNLISSNLNIQGGRNLIPFIFKAINMGKYEIKLSRPPCRFAASIEELSKKYFNLIN